MSPKVATAVQGRNNKRTWVRVAAGVLIGLLAAVLGAVGSVNSPHRAWFWAVFYLALAVLFSPPSVGLLWLTRRDGRWRLVTSARDLSDSQRGFFLGLSGALALDAVAFFSAWAVVALNSALS